MTTAAPLLTSGQSVAFAKLPTDRNPSVECKIARNAPFGLVWTWPLHEV